jgi:hypothetical protein
MLKDHTPMYKDKKVRGAFVEKAKEIFEAKKGEFGLEAGVVGIEPESGDVFVSAMLGEVNAKAYAKYPDEWIYYTRIEDPDAGLPLRTW